MQERSRGSVRGRFGFSSGFALAATMVLAGLGVGLMGRMSLAQERTPEQVLAEIQKRWDDKLAELRKKGEPVSMAELAPPAVPDDQNAAVLYEEAFTLLKEIPAETDTRLKELLPPNGPAPKAENIAEARKLLEPCKPALDLVRQGTLRAKCRFDLGYDAAPLSMLLPHLSPLQRACRLLSYESWCKVAEGRPDDAVADCVTMLRVADGLKDEPILIDQLVRFAVIGMGTNGLQRVLDQSEPGEAALREAVGVLAGLDSRESIVLTMRGERCYGLAMIRQMLDDPAGTVKFFAGKTIETDISKQLMLEIMGRAARPMLLVNASDYLDRMGQVLELSAKPYYQGHDAFKQLEDQVEQEYKTNQLAHVFTGILLPGLSDATAAFDRSLVTTRNARLAIALRLYRIKHGQYPDNLAVLVPDFIDRLPTDPFSGKDFIYRREGKGFVLESVGDDGLNAIDWKTRKCSR